MTLRDSILTIRLPALTRRRIEQVAKREGRSISGAAERLIEMGLAQEGSGAGMVAEGPVTAHPSTLAGCLSGGLVPSLDDFREVRAELSASMAARPTRHAKPRR